MIKATDRKGETMENNRMGEFLAALRKSKGYTQ